MGDGTFLMGGLRNNTLSGDSRLAFPGYRDVVSPIIGATISSQRQSVWADNDVILTDLLFSTSDYQRVLNANPADPQTLWERMRITHEGLVGINTSAPSQILEVNGNIKLTANSGSGIYFDDGGPPQTTAWTGILPGVDYADSVAVSGIRADYEPGDVLIIDTAHPGSFVKTSKSYSTLVGGVYSTKPGVLGKRKTSETDGGTEVPLALNGIVPTKVSTENGPVHAGDLLVSATLPGYAMKGTDRSLLTGAVLGKALGSVESATGVIDVLIALQ